MVFFDSSHTLCGLLHRIVDRFMWVRFPHFSYALTSLSLPRLSTTYRHIRDMLIQFEVPVA